MTTRVIQDLTLAYSVHQYVFNDLTIDYEVTNEVLKDVELVYFVQGVKDATVIGNKINITKSDRILGIYL